ncbi:MAG: putative lipid II flippase FtsW [Candidatus Latescibacteria bacterium]|nr:putative lipid II flippase FtsW [Candidatus Latescibacterota bacterium]
MIAPPAERFDRRPYLLALLVFGLVGFGTVMVYSASAALGEVRFESGHFFLKRWVLRMLVSLVAMGLVMRVDYRLWARCARAVLALGFLGLGVVLVFKLLGVGSIRGAYRWIHFSGMAFQPSDLMRLALVIYLAESLSRRRALVREFHRGYLPHIAIVGMAMGLITLQPDLGTAMAIGLTCTLMLYVGGVRLTHLLATGLALLPALYTVVFVIGYRKERIVAFLNPSADTQGAGYHVAQSLVALGSGGWTGTGLGQSIQKYFFLPEPHTDFVFSIVGEELGLAGTVGLLLLFLFFGRLGFQIARRAPDLHGYLLAAGVTLMVLVYAMVNMGVCTGLLPTTGLPLPFISYGGSSLLLTLVASGILINIGRAGAENPSRLPPQTHGSSQRIYRPVDLRT